MILYKANDPDQAIIVPTLAWGSDGFTVGLDEVSIGNEWFVNNLGNAIALRRGVDWGNCTVTVNFADITIGNEIVITTSTQERNDVGVFTTTILGNNDWRADINIGLEKALFAYFVDHGDWTLNENGIKSDGARDPGLTGYSDTDQDVLSAQERLISVLNNLD